MIGDMACRTLRHTTMFTYSHANTPLGQSECAYYLSYFIKGWYLPYLPVHNVCLCIICTPILDCILKKKEVRKQRKWLHKTSLKNSREKRWPQNNNIISLDGFCWEPIAIKSWILSCSSSTSSYIQGFSGFPSLLAHHKIIYAGTSQ